MDQIIKTTIKISLLSLSIMMFLTAILFSCDNKSIDLGSHFIYDTEHQYISRHQIGILYPLIIKHQPNRKDIPPIVMDYKYDNDYILVKQKPKIPLEQIYYDYNEIIYPSGLDTTYYWIIADFNRIQDPFINLPVGYTIKIPVLSNIEFKE